MPLDVLRRLALAKLPVEVRDLYSVECIVVLEAAGYLNMTVEDGADGLPISAVVHQITPTGLRVLSGQDEPP